MAAADRSSIHEATVQAQQPHLMHSCAIAIGSGDQRHLPGNTCTLQRYSWVHHSNMMATSTHLQHLPGHLQQAVCNVHLGIEVAQLCRHLERLEQFLLGRF